MATGQEAHVPLIQDGKQDLNEAIKAADEALRPVLEELRRKLEGQHIPESLISSDVRLG